MSPLILVLVGEIRRRWYRWVFKREADLLAGAVQDAWGLPEKGSWLTFLSWRRGEVTGLLAYDLAGRHQDIDWSHIVVPPEADYAMVVRRHGTLAAAILGDRWGRYSWCIADPYQVVASHLHADPSGIDGRVFGNFARFHEAFDG